MSALSYGQILLFRVVGNIYSEKLIHSVNQNLIKAQSPATDRYEEAPIMCLPSPEN